MPTHLPEAELTDLVTGLLARHAVERTVAHAVATSVVAAERDGSTSHGLTRLPGYLSSLQSGWVDGRAPMRVHDAAPGVVLVDAANGFAQGGLALARELAIAKAHDAGIAAIGIHHSHHFGALWPDVEPFAEGGLVALAWVHARSRMVAPGARRPVLGTNPMAAAFPRANGPALVWDQASTVLANGDVILAARAGHELPPDAGVDRYGRPTRDPNAVLDGGAMLPVGGHKGFLLALLAEAMAAALTGSRFGFENTGEPPGGLTTDGGQFLILVDPGRTGGGDFASRFDVLLATLAEAGTQRLPGDRRYTNRMKARAEGIAVDDECYRLLTQQA
jgi:delta1-piperideine-2-carboxylate reductase